MRVKFRLIDIITFLVLISYLKPYNITLISSINLIYNCLKIAATGLLIIYSLKRFKLQKSSKLCIIFSLIWGISIYINNGDIGDKFQNILSLIGISILFSYINTDIKAWKNMIHILVVISKIYIVLQFVTVIIDRPLIADAVISYEKYFLGSDNYSAFMLIPLCIFIFLESYLKKGRITYSSIIFGAIGWLCLAIPFSFAGLAGYSILLVGICFYYFPSIRKLIKVKYAIVFVIIFLISVVGFNVQENFNGILSVIGKKGLNSRDTIWPMAVDAIMKEPLIGYGSLTQEQIKSYILYGATHAHNIVLEFLMSTGIIGTVVVVFLIKNILKDIKHIDKRIRFIIELGLASYTICSIFDFYISLIYFWLLLFVIESCIKMSGKYEIVKG